MATATGRTLGRTAAAVLLSLSLGHAATAQSLIRDAGVENALEIMAYPLLSAANLPASNIRILVVNDMSLNAFVMDGRAVFINAGLLLPAADRAGIAGGDRP